VVVIGVGCVNVAEICCERDRGRVERIEGTYDGAMWQILQIYQHMCINQIELDGDGMKQKGKMQRSTTYRGAGATHWSNDTI